MWKTGRGWEGGALSPAPLRGADVHTPALTCSARLCPVQALPPPPQLMAEGVSSRSISSLCCFNVENMESLAFQRWEGPVSSTACAWISFVLAEPPRQRHFWQLRALQEGCDMKYPIPPLCTQGDSCAGDNGAAGEERGAEGLPLTFPRPPRWDAAGQEQKVTPGGLPSPPWPHCHSSPQGKGRRRSEQEGQEERSTHHKPSKIKPAAGSLLTNKQQPRCCCVRVTEFCFPAT